MIVLRWIASPAFLIIILIFSLPPFLLPLPPSVWVEVWQVEVGVLLAQTLATHSKIIALFHSLLQLLLGEGLFERHWVLFTPLPLHNTWCSLVELSAVLKDIEKHGSEWPNTCRVQLEKLSAKLLSFFSASVPKLPTKVDSLVTSFTSSSVICDENLPVFKVLKRISWNYHFTLSVDGRVSCWLTARQKWRSLSCLWFLITLWIGASLLPFVSSISSVPAYVTST